MRNFFTKSNKSEIIKELNNKNKELNNKNKELNNKNKELNNKNKELNNKNKELNKNTMTIGELKELDYIIPDFQRISNEEHIQKLAESIIKEPNFITYIHLGYQIVNGKEIIKVIDGQHRLKVIKNYELDKNIKVPVKKYKFENDNEFKKIFLIVNNTLPIKDIFKLTEERKIKLINSVYKRLKIKFNYYIRITRRRPYITENNLKDGILKILNDNYKKGINNDKSLENIINTTNKNYHNFYLDKSDTYTNGLKTIRKQQIPFYLGLHSDWYDHIFDENIEINRERPSINDFTKNESWNNNYGEISKSICICCREEPVTKRNCHYGHIIPFKNGGLTTYTNLIPICMNCNISMGDKNMFDYMIDNNLHIEKGKELKKSYERNKYFYTMNY